MTISVLIITKNRSIELTKCLLSLTKQSITPTEVIIVENNKNFSLKKIENKFSTLLNVCFFTEKEQNLSVLRNKALSAATGQIMAFIDDDCIADSQWLEKIHTTFNENKKVCGVIGRNFSVNPSNFFSNSEQLMQDLYLEDHFNLNKNQRLSTGVFFDTKNVAVRKSTIDKYNLHFNEKSSFKSEDADFGLTLYSKLQKSEELWFCPEMRVYHRNNESLWNFLKKRYLEGKEKYYLIQTFPDFENTKKKTFILKKNNFYLGQKLLFRLSRYVQYLGFLKASLSMSKNVQYYSQ